MQKERGKGNEKRDPLPEEFSSIHEAAAFWEHHDSSEYEDIMEQAEFEVNIDRHVYLVPIAGTIFDQLTKRARSEGVSTETFINVLLREHS